MSETSNGERGMSMVEALISLALISVVVGSVVSYSVDWLAKDQLRSSSYLVYSKLMETRLQALNRNRACRLLVDTSSKTLSVVDLNDPGDASDDTTISQVTLPDVVFFSRPDAGAVVTLNGVSGSVFEAAYSSTGVITSGAGNVFLRSNNEYRQVSVFVAGGLQLQHWSGAEWVEGL